MGTSLGLEWEVGGGLYKVTSVVSYDLLHRLFTTGYVLRRVLKLTVSSLSSHVHGANMIAGSRALRQHPGASVSCTRPQAV